MAAHSSILAWRIPGMEEPGGYSPYHIIWNSTALDCTRKFRNFWGSTAAVRKLSDLICTEHRLSVIENPAKHGKSYNKWLGNEYKLSNRDLLRMAIDQAIQNSPRDIDELIRFLQEAGYTVKRGKHLSFRPEGQKQFIRLRSLGDGYGEDDLLAVLKNEKKHVPFEKKKYPRRQQKTTLVSQLEAKINTGKGFGYDQAMKVIKLKQMAKTIMFAEEKGFEDFADLARATADAESHFYELKTKIKTAETRMVEIQSLKTHIINYVKTKEAWDGYCKSGYSKKYLVEHEGEIILHRASKKAFDDLGLKKLPTVKSLNAEFATLLTEKKAAYADYHAAQSEMRELMTHKANVEYILGINEQSAQRKEYQYE